MKQVRSSQEEEYFYRLNKELLEQRRVDLDAKKDAKTVQPCNSPGHFSKFQA